eukprot:9910389-Heterocapsa_arctica.AAC.1
MTAQGAGGHRDLLCGGVLHRQQRGIGDVEYSKTITLLWQSNALGRRHFVYVRSASGLFMWGMYTRRTATSTATSSSCTSAFGFQQHYTGRPREDDHQ